MPASLETREERFAHRLSQKLDLHPPVDVLNLARAYADVYEMLFPIDVDGLCRDLKRPGVRPQIWINRSLGHHRRRFTIAHEIGHVIIPWHTGTIVDDLDADDPSEHSDYFHMEGEANRFAAELLMPRAWAESICQRAEHLRDAMHAIAQGAEVSLFAAALRTTQVGPPGYIVAGVTDEFVTWVGKTKGTRGRPPHHAQHVSTIDMVAYGDPELLSYGPTTYYWWKELEGVPAPPKPLEPWREILSRVLTVVPSSERKKTQMQLNAIIGYAIGKLPKGTPVDQLYMRALEGLQNRSDYNPYVVAARHHPDFHDYVLARVHERAEAR